MQGAARVAQQATGNGVVAGQQVGVDHLAQAWGDVFPLFDHQHAVEDFPLHRTVGAVDDAKAGMPGRYRQGVGFAGVAVDGHRDFIVVGLALAGGQLRGVVEQASGGDHHHHRAGHAPAQGAGRRGRLRGWVGQETVLTGWKRKKCWQQAGSGPRAGRTSPGPPPGKSDRRPGCSRSAPPGNRTYRPVPNRAGCPWATQR